MSSKTAGIQPVPAPPLPSDADPMGSREWMDMLEYRNKLVETRNAQLEYRQTATHLYDKVRQACRDLTKRDNSVREGMEILSMERQRLGYLRDELARRADMIARWESRLRDTELKTSGVEVDLRNAASDSEKRRVDRMNALLLEMEQQKKLQGHRVPVTSVAAPSSSSGTSAMDFGIQGNPNASETVFGGEWERNRAILTQQQFEAVKLKKRSPVSAAVGSDDINEIGTFSPGDAIVVDASDVSPAVYAPRPYASQVDKPLSQAVSSDDTVVDEMRDCLDYIWSEYSTEIGGETDRLMTLPNLMRLCADANLTPPTQGLIEIYLRATKAGKSCLVERSSLLGILQSVLSVCGGRSSSDMQDPVRSTGILFSQYLMPLVVRLKAQRTTPSKNHPSLVRRSLELPRPASLGVN